MTRCVKQIHTLQTYTMVIKFNILHLLLGLHKIVFQFSHQNPVCLPSYSYIKFSDKQHSEISMAVEILLHLHNVVGYPKRGSPWSLWMWLIAVTYYATYCTCVECNFWWYLYFWDCAMNPAHCNHILDRQGTCIWNRIVNLTQCNKVIYRILCIIYRAKCWREWVFNLCTN
jgi:hypothetical protein